MEYQSQNLWIFRLETLYLDSLRLYNCTFRWKTRGETFEALWLYCSKNLSNIRLTFMLDFYVSLVVNRWWKQYKILPWPNYRSGHILYICG